MPLTSYHIKFFLLSLFPQPALLFPLADKPMLIFFIFYLACALLATLTAIHGLAIPFVTILNVM